MIARPQAHNDELEAGQYKLKPQPLPYFLSAEQTDGTSPPFSVIETSADLWIFVELPGVVQPKLAFRPMLQGVCRGGDAAVAQGMNRLVGPQHCFNVDGGVSGKVFRMPGWSLPETTNLWYLLSKNVPQMGRCIVHIAASAVFCAFFNFAKMIF